MKPSSSSAQALPALDSSSHPWDPDASCPLRTGDLHQADKMTHERPLSKPSVLDEGTQREKNCPDCRIATLEGRGSKGTLGEGHPSRA